MAGTVVADTLQAASTSQLVLQNGVASTPPTFADSAGTQIGTLCRAWVNFNGVTTVTVRASFNVSSVTRNSAGDYTINFTTALSDANYAVNVSGITATTTDGRAAYLVKGTRSTGTPSTQTTSAVGIQSLDTAAAGWTAIDSGYVCVSIFR